MNEKPTKKQQIQDEKSNLAFALNLARRQLEDNMTVRAYNTIGRAVDILSRLNDLCCTK